MASNDPTDTILRSQYATASISLSAQEIVELRPTLEEALLNITNIHKSYRTLGLEYHSYPMAIRQLFADQDTQAQCWAFLPSLPGTKPPIIIDIGYLDRTAARAIAALDRSSLGRAHQHITRLKEQLPHAESMLDHLRHEVRKLRDLMARATHDGFIMTDAGHVRVPSRFPTNYKLMEAFVLELKDVKKPIAEGDISRDQAVGFVLGPPSPLSSSTLAEVGA